MTKDKLIIFDTTLHDGDFASVKAVAKVINGSGRTHPQRGDV